MNAEAARLNNVLPLGQQPEGNLDPMGKLEEARDGLYSLLKGLCKNKFRAPGAMISKLVNDYVAFLAKKEKVPVDTMRKKLLNGSKE